MKISLAGLTLKTLAPAIVAWFWEQGCPHPFREVKLSRMVNGVLW
jgi:hypothetical protein